MNNKILNKTIELLVILNAVFASVCAAGETNPKTKITIDDVSFIRPAVRVSAEDMRKLREQKENKGQVSEGQVIFHPAEQKAAPVNQNTQVVKQEPKKQTATKQAEQKNTVANQNTTTAQSKQNADSTPKTKVVVRKLTADEATEEFVVAIQKKDVEQVRKFLNANIDVNRKDKKACPPFHYAVKAKDPRIMNMLILSGADVNATDSDGNTPLHYPYNSVATVRRLLDAGANIEAKNNDGDTPLMTNITNPKAATVLVNAGADIYVKNNKGRNPFDKAFLYENMEESKEIHDYVILLLATGMDVKNEKRFYEPPLVSAAGKSFDITEFLVLLTDANVNAKNGYGETPLMRAKNAEITKLLLEHGADVNAQDYYGQTPLMHAKTAEQALVLVDGHADIRLTDRQNRTAEDVALKDNKAEVLNILKDIRLKREKEKAAIIEEIKQRQH